MKPKCGKCGDYKATEYVGNEWRCLPCLAKDDRENGDTHTKAYKKMYVDKVWGGELLGWTTQAEVNALDKSIETDW